MTMPPDAAPDAMQSQILIKLGAMGEDLAVIKDRMGALKDHEDRIRQLERDNSEGRGKKDLVSRVWATAAAAAAVGSAVIAYLHK